MKGLALCLMAALAVSLSPVSAGLAQARDHGDKGSQQRRGEGHQQQRGGGRDFDRGQRGSGRPDTSRQERSRQDDGDRRPRGQGGYEGYRPSVDRYGDPLRGRDRYEGERPRRDDRWDRPGPSARPPSSYAPPEGRRNAVRPGGYLGPEYRGGAVYDYQRYRLRPPPRGFSWVRVGNGFALVSPDGQVFDVIQ